jgi:hypothetical protein
VLGSCRLSAGLSATVVSAWSICCILPRNRQSAWAHCCNTVNQGQSLECIVVALIWGNFVMHSCNWLWITLSQQWCWKTLSLISLLHLLYPWLPHWCYCPWCGVKNTVGFRCTAKSMYAFPILLHTKNDEFYMDVKLRVSVYERTQAGRVWGAGSWGEYCDLRERI